MNVDLARTIEAFLSTFQNLTPSQMLWLLIFLLVVTAPIYGAFLLREILREMQQLRKDWLELLRIQKEALAESNKSMKRQVEVLSEINEMKRLEHELVYAIQRAQDEISEGVRSQRELVGDGVRFDQTDGYC